MAQTQTRQVTGHGSAYMVEGLRFGRWARSPLVVATALACVATCLLEAVLILRAAQASASEASMSTQMSHLLGALSWRFLVTIPRLLLEAIAVASMIYQLLNLSAWLRIMLSLLLGNGGHRRLLGIGLTAISLSLLPTVEYGQIALASSGSADSEESLAASRGVVSQSIVRGQVMQVSGGVSPFLLEANHGIPQIVRERTLGSATIWSKGHPFAIIPPFEQWSETARGISTSGGSAQSLVSGPKELSSLSRNIRLAGVFEQRSGTSVEHYHALLRPSGPGGPCHSGVGGLPA